MALAGRKVSTAGTGSPDLDEIRTWMDCMAGQTQSRRLAAEAMFSVG